MAVPCRAHGPRAAVRKRQGLYVAGGARLLSRSPTAACRRRGTGRAPRAPPSSARRAEAAAPAHRAAALQREAVHQRARVPEAATDETGIGFEPLDNGILSCTDPEAMQRLADGLTVARVDALLRKWLARLPHPFSSNDREQGIRYDISILQAEFARTEVFDRPVAGRVFFEEVMRENLDMGRPDHMQLIFDRRVSRRTPTRYRTRVIADGVIPSLHVDYKHSCIKQYHKEGRALRTETVINDTYDFDVGRRLKNLDDLKQIGFRSQPTPARRRTPQPRRHHRSRDARCLAPSGAHRRPTGFDAALRGPSGAGPACRAVALRPAAGGIPQPRVREAVAPLRGMSLDDYNAGQMTYDLRRLRLRGLSERIPRSQRYRLTAGGLCIALAYHRTQARVLGRSCRPRSTASRPPVCRPPSPRTIARSATSGKDTRWPRDRENRTVGAGRFQT